MKCEMCDSTDLVKTDGLYVCQSCGTKYEPAEARKLMVEIDGTVDVSGSSVKIDKSAELESLYKMAHQAKASGSGDLARTYYQQILTIEPTSWEASFYVVYYKVEGCTIANIHSSAILMKNTLPVAFKQIHDTVESRQERMDAAAEVAAKGVYIGEMLFNSAFEYFRGLDFNIRPNYTQEMLNRCVAATDVIFATGDNLDLYFDDIEELCELATRAWDSGIQRRNALRGFLADTEANKALIESYIAKIRKYKPDYQTTATGGGGGCYVATAVYGSYDCPQVWVLRRYRDQDLAGSLLGRACIKTYYAISPTIVKWFGDTKWFSKLWRPKLDALVRHCQERGYSDKPYQDRNW